MTLRYVLTVEVEDKDALDNEFGEDEQIQMADETIEDILGSYFQKLEAYRLSDEGEKALDKFMAYHEKMGNVVIVADEEFEDANTKQ